MASLGDLSRLLATPSADTEKWAALTTCFMGEPAGQAVAERKAQSLVLHSLSQAVRAAQPLIISRWARGIPRKGPLARAWMALRRGNVF